MKSLVQLIMGPPGLILIGAILCAIGALWSSHQQANFERDLRIKSEKIAKLQEDTINSVIGGDSFCYLVVGSVDNNANTGILTVVHEGEHPIYDVTARFVDLEKFEKIKDNMTFQTMKQAETNLPIGNMIPNTASAIGTFSLGNTHSKNFNVFFSARNGLFRQLLRYRKVDGSWESAIKVKRNEKEMFEKISDKFPRNADGKIEW